MQQRTPDRKREQIIDDVEHNKFPHLSPDFGLMRRADVQQQLIQHFAGVVTGHDSFKAALDGRKRYVRDVCMLQGCLQGEPEQSTHLLG